MGTNSMPGWDVCSHIKPLPPLAVLMIYTWTVMKGARESLSQKVAPKFNAIDTLLIVQILVKSRVRSTVEGAYLDLRVLTSCKTYKKERNWII